MRAATRRGAAVAGAAVLCAAAVGSVAGCATTAPSGAGFDARVVQVVAAENFWGSIAAQLGGVHAHVDSIITNPNADPHSYEPTAADARAVATAQLVVVNQVGYDPWADSLAAADPSSARIELGVGTLVGVAPGGNPHRWYSPADVTEVVDAMTADFQKLDPADSAYFAQRRTWFEDTALAPYRALIASIRDKYAGTPIGASESIMVPLAQALGLDLVTPASFLDAVSEGNDPTTSDKALIDRQISGHEIKVYVYNSQNATPDVAAQLTAAKAAGIPVTSITETLSPAGLSFQAWQVDELTRLEAALAAGTGR